jgi:hypothetical protein
LELWNGWRGRKKGGGGKNKLKLKEEITTAIGQQQPNLKIYKENSARLVTCL